MLGFPIAWRGGLSRFAFAVLLAGEGYEPDLLRYSYYTAGSGGAGPTILQTSFLLAGEPVTVYNDDKQFELPPISYKRVVDFGLGE